MTNVVEIVDGQVQSVQDWMRDRIADAVEAGIERRRTYWQQNPGDRPRIKDLKQLRRNVARRNAGIAGAATLVPGPTGLVTIPAELFLTLRNSVELVYDIAVAYDREDEVTPAVVVAIAFTDAGGLLGALHKDGDTQTAMKRPQRRLLGKLVKLAGRQLMKRVLRAAFGRVVPVVGAAAVAWWTRGETLRTAQRAQQFFADDRPIVDLTPEEEATIEAEVDRQLQQPPEVELSGPVREARHAFLANMLRSVPSPALAQLDLFDQLSDAPELGNSHEVLARESDLQINLPVLASLDTEDLWTDVATLAAAGNPPSTHWRKEHAVLFGMDLDEVDELLAYQAA